MLIKQRVLVKPGYIVLVISFCSSVLADVQELSAFKFKAPPERWLDLLEAMGGRVGAESLGPGLQEWLEDMYFDGERREDLTGEDIAKLGQII